MARELSPLQKAYSEFFFAMMDEFDVTSPSKISDEKKKEFFNRIKKEWPAAKRKVTQEGTEKDSIRNIIREIILDELANRELLTTLAKDRDFDKAIDGVFSWWKNLVKSLNFDRTEKQEMKKAALEYMDRIMSKY